MSKKNVDKRQKSTHFHLPALIGCYCSWWSHQWIWILDEFFNHLQLLYIKVQFKLHSCVLWSFEAAHIGWRTFGRAPWTTPSLWHEKLDRYACTRCINGGSRVKCLLLWLVKVVRDAVGAAQKEAVMVKSSSIDLVTQTDQKVEKLIIQSVKEKFPTHWCEATRLRLCASRKANECRGKATKKVALLKRQIERSHVAMETADGKQRC